MLTFLSRLESKIFLIYFAKRCLKPGKIWVLQNRSAIYALHSGVKVSEIQIWPHIPNLFDCKLSIYCFDNKCSKKSGKSGKYRVRIKNPDLKFRKFFKPKIFQNWILRWVYEIKSFSIMSPSMLLLLTQNCLCEF